MDLKLVREDAMRNHRAFGTETALSRPGAMSGRRSTASIRTGKNGTRPGAPAQ